MWFKKALFYRFYQEVPFTEAELIAALTEAMGGERDLA